MSRRRQLLADALCVLIGLLLWYFFMGPEAVDITTRPAGVP